MVNLDNISTKDYLSWQQYNEEEPFWWEQLKLSIERLEGRLIWMVAQLTTVVHNIIPGSTAADVDEFIPQWIGEELTEEQEMAMMNAKFDKFNAQVDRYFSRRRDGDD